MSIEIGANNQKYIFLIEILFIDRKFKYNPKGRFQTEEESDEVRVELLKWLQDNGFNFHYLKVPVKERMENILNILEIGPKESEVTVDVV